MLGQRNCNPLSTSVQHNFKSDTFKNSCKSMECLRYRAEGGANPPLTLVANFRKNPRRRRRPEIHKNKNNKLAAFVDVVRFSRNF